MKLILLYGPPAVGKLTIAKEIARLTGLKLFHAHLTVALVAAIFPRGTPAYRKLVWDLQYAVFAEAAQAHLDGLIFTTVYGRDREQFIARCIEVVEPFRRGSLFCACALSYRDLATARGQRRSQTARQNHIRGAAERILEHF
jgi:hypothetical protein